jgi:hypothetical protein
MTGGGDPQGTPRGEDARGAQIGPGRGKVRRRLAARVRCDAHGSLWNTGEVCKKKAEKRRTPRNPFRIQKQESEATFSSTVSCPRSVMKGQFATCPLTMRQTVIPFLVFGLGRSLYRVALFHLLK